MAHPRTHDRGPDLARLTAARDAALVALAGAYLGTAALHGWAGRSAPPFSVFVFLALLLSVAAARELYRIRPAPWSANALAIWPVAFGPAVYFAAVRLVEFDPGRYVDATLMAIDTRLGIAAGGVPIWPAGGPLEEVANALYASYYAVPFVAVWLGIRHGPVEGVRTTTALVFSTLACGLLWLLWPAGGYHPTGSPTGDAFGPFTAFVRGIYAAQPHFAAAFPSEHVAHATTLAAVLRGRGHGAWVWAWAAGIALSTVIGGYHFAADGVAGFVVGLAAAALATWVTAPRPDPGFDARKVTS